MKIMTCQFRDGTTACLHWNKGISPCVSALSRPTEMSWLAAAVHHWFIGYDKVLSYFVVSASTVQALEELCCYPCKEA